MDEKQKKEDNEGNLQQIAVYISIPFVLAVPPIIGWLIGRLLDRYFQTDPYFTYFLIVCGLISGFRELYRMIKKYGDPH